MGLFSRAKKVVKDVRRIMYGLIMPGTLLQSDYLDNYLEEGFNNNGTVFGMMNKMARIFANIPIIAKKGDDILEDDPLMNYFNNHSADYTFFEFQIQWALSGYALGESIFHATKSNSINHPSLLNIDLIPAHKTEIIAGDWRNPVSKYILDIDSGYELDAKDVYHSRLFPNLVYENGSNFRGVSPLKVAANTIMSMNKGDIQTAKTLNAGMPPGILADEDIESIEVGEEQQAKFEEAWREKYSNAVNKNINYPIYAGGKLRWTPIGFSNLKDLMIIENFKQGRSVLCNVWGVSEELFSSENSTYNNKKTAPRLDYQSRFLPDKQIFISILNKIVYPLWGYKYEIDISQIDVLNDDLLEKAKVWSLGRDKYCVTIDEWRENVLKLEPFGTSETGQEGLLDEQINRYANSTINDGLEEAGK